MSGNNFGVGDFVRYVPDGPRRAYGGAIGIVAEPSEKGRELGWIRVNLAGRSDDYAADELEPARFWVYCSSSEVKWAGPLSSWTEAILFLSQRLQDTIDLPPGHPLSHKRDDLSRWFVTAAPSSAGMVGYHSTGGEYRVEVGGSEQPFLYDSKGKRRA